MVVSNERSANYGNTEYLGETINHQWSKTAEFEVLFQNYVKKYITPDITYFSLLRSYSEYKITQLFAEYPSYFGIFSSCNKNYAIHTDLPHTKWCGACPKCAFVFIMLAAFISKEKVLSIFGQNLLEKESLLLTYKELLGIEGVKPFECVGTPEEVLLAFYKTYTKGEYNNSIVMKMFESEVLP
ncbi:MAG TPA: endonuclease domain-containing protein, partial [Candidatus Woesebacteria bacterium]|nr:endonuclease domain-containing protein [Candidatus Woesebacteria bacterium]